MQDYVVGLAAGLQLEPQADPPVRLVCSGVIEGRDGINKGKEASVRSTTWFNWLMSWAHSLSSMASRRPLET